MEMEMETQWVFPLMTSDSLGMLIAVGYGRQTRNQLGRFWPKAWDGAWNFLSFGAQVLWATCGRRRCKLGFTFRFQSMTMTRDRMADLHRVRRIVDLKLIHRRNRNYSHFLFFSRFARRTEQVSALHFEGLLEGFTSIQMDHVESNDSTGHLSQAFENNYSIHEAACKRRHLNC